MSKIKDLFSRSIDRKIEEVIQVDQHDDQTVLREIEEYVVTDSLKEHFYEVYDKVAKYNHEPHRGIGVWVSGFFGSGKSSYAKLLGYTLANRTIAGKNASDLFIENAKDSKISSYLQNINPRFKIHSVIFDVSMDRGVRMASDRISEVMYKVLLRELNYPVDFDLADLEIMLETEKELEKFEEIYKNKFGKEWSKGKKVVTNALNEASVVLNELKPEKYTTPESWLLALGKEGRADIDANRLAKLTFELVSRRKPGYGIIYIIDEVGQYVARSTDKMLDLQAVVQALGKESENRVKAGQAKVPAWVIVTSQEKLDEVVDALDSKRIELARLQDRFPVPIDLKQSDIQEVTSKRVLDKTKDARELLGKLYDKYEGQIKTFCSLKRTHRKTTFTRDEFIDLYPYLPYQIDLSIDIVSGLRMRRGAQRHVGGSNRTIIKQAQQMLIHPKTNLGDKSPGSLVTLDLIYELLHSGNLLPTEISNEIATIPKRLPGNEMALKIAKSIALMEVVRDLPRTTHNIAAVLHQSIESGSQENEVNKALKELEDAQFVRETEQGYKLLTVVEKTWDVERRKREPKGREKHDIVEDFTKDIFSEPSLTTLRYKNLKTFSLGVLLNNRKIRDGSIVLDIRYADDKKEYDELFNQVKKTSRTEEHINDNFWLFYLTENLHQQITDYYQSQSMVQEYSRIQAQGQINAEELACLEDEKQRGQRTRQKLKSELIKVIEGGTSIFQGVDKNAALLGQHHTEMFRTLFNQNIPKIYSKLEMGARNMSGKEAELILKSANLNGLPALFYSPPDGLDLIIKDGTKFVPNTNAPVVQEIFKYMKSEYDYGNKVTGKILENHFEEPPHGWERDLMRLIMAHLYRAGILEVTHQGHKYKSYGDPNSWQAFINNMAFRSATFTPRETVSIKVLTDAARYLEEITGHEIDVDEQVIAAELKTLVQDDSDILSKIFTNLRYNNLPEVEKLKEFESSLKTILNSSSEEAVKILAAEGNTYKENRSLNHHLASVLTPENIEILVSGKQAMVHLFPILVEHGIDGDMQEKQEKLAEFYETEGIYDNIESIRIYSQSIFKAYKKLYEQEHKKRDQGIQKAEEKVKGYPRFAELKQDQQDTLLHNFKKRMCNKLSMKWDGSCSNCSASFQQLESEILSIDKLVDAVIAKVIEWTSAEDVVAVSVTKYFQGEYSSAEEFESRLEEFKEHVIKLILEKKKVIIR